MKQKQRTNETIPQNTIPGEPGGDDLAAAQQQMDALLSAADATISAALSTDSSAFLDSTRQRGGQ